MFSFKAFALEADGKGSFSATELQDLVAPIALYPDPLLAQVLPASTYPLEIVDAARLIKKKKDFSKIDAQDWDPSVKAVAHYPDVLKMMNQDLGWTQRLGQAVLDQQEDVMRAVQVLRGKAISVGSLKTNKHQTVQGYADAIEIVPTDREVVYVPRYNPQIVYVAAPVSVVASSWVSFSVGWALGPWLTTGCWWPSYQVVYGGGPYWGYGWYRSGYRSYYNNHYQRNVYVNRTTNIYNNTHIYNRTNNVNVANHDYRPWNHDGKRGNPYTGRRWDKEGDWARRPNPDAHAGNNDPHGRDKSPRSWADRRGSKDRGEIHKSKDRSPRNPEAVREAQRRNLDRFRHGMKRDHPEVAERWNRGEGEPARSERRVSRKYQPNPGTPSSHSPKPEEKREAAPENSDRQWRKIADNSSENGSSSSSRREASSFRGPSSELRSGSSSFRSRPGPASGSFRRSGSGVSIRRH